MPALQITFRGLPPSPFVVARVQELTDKLERFERRITSCHVTIQSPHHHQRQGQLYDVRVRLCVPGAELVFNHEGSRDRGHEDVYVALRDTFEAATRKLEDRAHQFSGRRRRQLLQ